MSAGSPRPPAPVLREHGSCRGPDAGLASSLLTRHGVWAKAGLRRELMEGLSAGALVQLGDIYIALSSAPACGMDPREVEEEGHTAS